MKYAYPEKCLAVRKSRSREGAWIEIVTINGAKYKIPSRSREGAWIEIHFAKDTIEKGMKVAPVRERGLKC